MASFCSKAFCLLYLFIFFSCQKPVKASWRLNPVEFVLIDHSLHSPKSQNDIPLWQARVKITNNTNDSIWVYQGSSTDVNTLICNVDGFNIRGENLAYFRYYLDLPMGNYQPIIPKQTKYFLIDLPLDGDWSCPDESYFQIKVLFSRFNHNSRVLKTKWADTLENNTTYQIGFPYHMEQNCIKITPIDDNIDSLFNSLRQEH